MPRLLIVEDQIPLLDSLTRGLREEGYEVLPAATIAEALVHIHNKPVDVIVLDLMLPDRDGLSLIRELRDSGFANPILITTARDAVEDRVAGLDTGADDYLIKPFSFEELLARLRAIMRRSRSTPESVLRVADLELNLLTRDVTRNGASIDLTQRQFELLACLVRHAGLVVAREIIAREVWEEATATWTNVIEVQVNHLRRKIERPGWLPLLHTIRGEGYLLGIRS
jgi:two-component system copper resistance phosphate regulon response regulator CusR